METQRQSSSAPRSNRHKNLLAIVAACASFAIAGGACTVAEARRPIPTYGTSYVLPSLPYGVRIDLLDEGGQPFPVAYRAGRRYVLGEAGRRYILRVVNPSGRRVEVVAAVDGLDVVDGKSAHFGKRGYIVAPGGELRIDGWRTSYSQVAAFRFGSVSGSYAGRTVGGRNVGVIGIALFAEREVPLPVEPAPLAGSYRGSEGYGGGRARDRASAEAAPTTPPPPPAAPPEASATRSAPGARPSVSAPRAAKAAAPAPSMSGGAVARREAPADEERPGLGTRFGERLTSSVRLVHFEREHAARPTAYAELRYNNRSGLAALGVYFPEPVVGTEEDLRLRESARPFPSNGFALPPQD